MNRNESATRYTREITVPFALSDDDELIAVQKAEKDRRYRCPACLVELRLRAGTQRIKHFSHPGNGSCSRESRDHRIGKLLVKAAIEANAEHGQPLELETRCAKCEVRESFLFPPGTFTHAAEEVRAEGCVIDIVGYRSGGSHLYIEILVSNRVSQEKAGKLTSSWIEVKADERHVSLGGRSVASETRH